MLFVEQKEKDSNLEQASRMPSQAKSYQLIITKPQFMLFITLLLVSVSLSTIRSENTTNNATQPPNNSTTTTTSSPTSSGISSQGRHNATAASEQQQFKLDCQPGEQRQFSYESLTKVWGSTDQQVRLRAILRLKCMEPPTNSTVKYLAEIVTLTPNFISQNEQASNKLRVRPNRNSTSSRRMSYTTKDLLPERFSGLENYSRRLVASQKVQLVGSSHLRSRLQEAEIDQMLRAEPLLEEVGEAAIRMKRSVSSWFSKAWVSVKDFFVNIFNSSERSTVSRDQAFKESGLDIAGQCKAASKGKGSSVGLPFDESVFEDLGPEYYVGASLDGATPYEFSSSGHASTLDLSSGSGGNQEEDADNDEMMSLSFFDDPAPHRMRTRRATNDKKSRSIQDSNDYEKLLRIPFVFLQSRSGKIVEIRFSGDETDLSVKNFKRHLCDLFATNLDWNKTTQNEVSPIGKHQTKYTLDSSENSMTAIKQTVLKANNDEERSNRQQLVRVLAMVGTNDRRHLKDSTVGDGNQTLVGSVNKLDGSYLDDDDDQGLADDQQAASRSLSVLRSINTTTSIQLSSKMLSADIDRMQVRVEQVQQINDGRLTGTAGQLSMSLVQMQQQQQLPTRSKRHASKDDTGDGGSGSERVSDISDLLKVSTSFSMQLVPIARNPDGSIDDESLRARSFRSSRSVGDSKSTSRRVDTNKNATTGENRKRVRKSPLVKLAPSDSQELQRVLQDWRKHEARLQLSSANLVTENNGQQESQLTRLDVIRDQIRQRLNEEFVRNRIRRSLGQQQMAAASRASDDPATTTTTKRPAQLAGGDFGLGLTQLVLGKGITTKRKGSIYSSIEEVMELEASLGDDRSDSAISSLMRDTVRMDKLRHHCKSSIPTLEGLSEAQQRRSSSNLQLERRLPFGLKLDNHDDYNDGSSLGDGPKSRIDQKESIRRTEIRARQVSEFEKRNDRKLEQCQQVLQLMLKLSDRQAIDLVIDLVDECNHRLLAAAKQEELGYGPMSKYYRRLRQQFIELLPHLSRPNDSLLEKLLTRLHYPKLTPADGGASKQNKPLTRPSGPEAEFVYVNQRPKDQLASTKYNKSLLKEEDDFNNNDGSALLVMALTSLAAKSSVSQSKRVEVAEKLLQSLKGTSCSLFSSPDLDIIESMANFQEPLDEIVGRILALARKCKQHDQYTVACIHGLSGQLQHPATQLFLVDLLKSQNSSCTIKSEIVMILIGAQLINDLSVQVEQLAVPAQWPSSGRNKVDDTLLELVGGNDSTREPDRRCLKSLVAHYMSKKHQAGSASTASPKSVSSTRSQRRSSSRSLGERRSKRAVVNEHQFWDEAQCKRWTMPADGGPPSGQFDLNSIFSSSKNQSHLQGKSGSKNDLIDEIDDNSILTALMNNDHQRGTAQTARGARRNQKLIERELDGPNSSNSSSSANSQQIQQQQQQNAFLRRRHKCVASKDFGPRNAQASLKAEIVNDLIGSKDENKFLARFRLSTNFLGNRIDVGRMYLWHQRRTTRAYANILGRSIWDSSHGCKDKVPNQVLYMPLFDFNLWLVKVSVGLRLNAEMGFFPNCDQPPTPSSETDAKRNKTAAEQQVLSRAPDTLAQNDELQLYPTISLKAAGEATAKLVVARAGMSLASQYSYQGDIRVSRQPESCMSIYSAHQPMNITFSSWFQLWDNDCHFWGSRGRAEPQAIKWRLNERKPTVWLEDECLTLARDGANQTATSNKPASDSSSSGISSGTSARLTPTQPVQINP